MLVRKEIQESGVKERLVVILITTIQCVSLLGCNARQVIHNRKRQQDCCQKV